MSTSKSSSTSSATARTISNHSTFIISACLIALRATLFLTPLPDWLRDDQQLNSPFTSFKRLREGVYLFHHGLDPYSGDIFRQSPILLALFSTILPTEPLPAAVLWSLCDAVSVWCLINLLRLRFNSTNTRQELILSIAYIFHPYTSLPTLALSSSSLDNTIYLITLYLAGTGSSSLALFTLAFLVCTSLPSILLLPPIILLCIRGPTASLSRRLTGPIDRRRVYRLTAVFGLSFSLLIAASSFVSMGFKWIPRTWGAVLTLPDLTPNPGLWWYFFTEMFDHFRPFFLLVFSAHLILYVGPVTLKLQHDPLFATFILQGIIATLKSYPTLSDPGLFTAMYALFPEIISGLRHPLPTVMLHVHSALLLFMFHDLWIGSGTGNANFFYASTLVFGLANGAAVTDALKAGLKLGYGKRGDGWKLVQI